MNKPEFAAHTPSDDLPDNEWHELKAHIEVVVKKAAVENEDDRVYLEAIVLSMDEWESNVDELAYQGL